MKNKKLLGSILLLSVYALTACTAGNDQASKQDDIQKFTVTKFSNNAMVKDESVSATISVADHKELNSPIHIDITSSDSTKLALDDKSKACDLSTKNLTCTVNVKAIDFGDATITFKSNTMSYTSEKLSVTPTNVIAISGLEVAKIVKGYNKDFSISLPQGAKLNKEVTLDIFAKDSNVLSVAFKDPQQKSCIFSTTNTRCDLVATGKNIGTTHISVQSSDINHISNKDSDLIETVQKETIYFSDFIAPTKEKPTGSANIKLTYSDDSKAYEFTVASDENVITISKDDPACKISRDNSCRISINRDIVKSGIATITATVNGFESITQKIYVYNFAIKQFVVGFSHSCIVNEDNSVYCLGDNSYGSVGTGSKSKDPILFPQNITTTDNSLTIGLGTTAIIKNQQIMQWGGLIANIEKDGENIENDRPTELTIDGGVKAVAVSSPQSGTVSMCAIKNNDNKIYCWGTNSSGQMGTEEAPDTELKYHSIAAIKSNMTFTKFANNIGGSTFCAITTDSKLYCWGDNSFGQINNSGVKAITTPTEIIVPEASKISEVSVGHQHVCALKENKNLYCWGDNTLGQTGVNSDEKQIKTPTLVQGDIKFNSITISDYSSCGITSDKKLYCWGIYAPGKVHVNKPILIDNIPGNPEIASVSLDNYYDEAWADDDFIIAAITTKGEVYAWGNNNYGMLGTGDRRHIEKPTRVLN